MNRIFRDTLAFQLPHQIMSLLEATVQFLYLMTSLQLEDQIGSKTNRTPQLLFQLEISRILEME